MGCAACGIETIDVRKRPNGEQLCDDCWGHNPLQAADKRMAAEDDTTQPPPMGEEKQCKP